jgi:hypothetical protein
LARLRIVTCLPFQLFVFDALIDGRASMANKADDLALQNQYWNPRALEQGVRRDLIRETWRGRSPTPLARKFQI